MRSIWKSRRTFFVFFQEMGVTICVLLFFGLHNTLLAQGGILSGTVRDAETRTGLPGANVVVTAENVQTGAATDSNGNFEVKNLAPGAYTVSVSFIGYATETLSLEVAEKQTRTLNIFLTPTGITLNPISISASRRPEKTLSAPASITVLEPREIMTDVSPSSAATLRNVTGVDMASTGIDRKEIVLRGFGNAFSGATYILTDYRRAAVPSLDVNLHSIMPNMAIDLERIEVVRGPGSALYGAGVDAGVIHYITKDPFDQPGTTLSFAGGQRSSLFSNFRHAGVVGARLGYKITGQYAEANDWALDPTDSLDAVQLRSDSPGLRRNTSYQKFNLNGLLEYKFGESTTLTANAGFSTLDATLLSGIGTVQAENFGYAYGQMRFRAGNFFAQAYLNKNDAGESFIYGTGNTVIDKSTLFNVQAQYDLEMAAGRQQLILGVDYDRTTPVTERSIFGINEENDLISEVGVYAQSLTELSPKLDLTVALRADYNNIEESFQVSPRAALVFKPTARHSVRATYNRAYDLPAANSLFLDIVAQVDTLAPGMVITRRGLGSIRGYTFDRAARNGGIVASGLLPVETVFGLELRYSGVGVPTRNIAFRDVYSVIYSNLSAIPTEEIQTLLAENGIVLDQQAVDLLLALLSPRFTVITDSASTEIEFAPVDVAPLKSTITHSVELGYKGLIGERLLFAVDGYYSIKKNFISGVTKLTPQAVYSNFRGEFVPALSTAIRRNVILNAALEANDVSSQQAAELIAQLAVQGGVEELGVGVVQTDQFQTPGQILGAFRNFGSVQFWGFDVTVQYMASDFLSFFGNLSFVSDDFFDDDELDEAGSGLQVALNATGFKWKTGLTYNRPRGVSLTSSFRYIKGFPVLSGPYSGRVESYYLWDAGAGYDFGRYLKGLRLDVMVQNVLDKEHREFIGAPEIGRLGLARLSYTLP